MSDSSQSQFIHLRCHSEYSISDGIVTICGGLVHEIKNELPESVQIFDNLVLDGLECYSQTVG